MNGEFFTAETLLTLSGATFVVLVISGTVQHAFDFNPKWFAFALSFIVSFIGVIIAGKYGISLLIAFLNGFLIYANSVGVVQVTGRNQTEEGGVDERYGSSENKLVKRKFWTKWY